MSTPFKDHFSARADAYARWRPGYPTELARLLADLAPARELALDCGCGTGQLSTLLAGEFDQVVAVDASQAQIEHAQAHPRVRYRTAPAERSGLADASVDLVTVAQAAHWFDLPAFYAEVRRVLRPGGCVVLVTYGLPTLEGRPGELLRELHDRVLGPYWPPERWLVVDGYRDLPFPFDRLHPDAPDMRVDWMFDDVLGYIQTWSALGPAQAALGQAPFDAFERELRAAWGETRVSREISWPLTLLAGRVA